MREPVARGRIKVDARKALDKLRDHLLVDPHLWASEIARVAIALGATRLDVSWTASDFVLEFDGRALPIAQIARARDHVLTPLDGTDGDALRSLGIGIGAALGLEPAFVEVTSEAERVRFERNYVDEGAETEAPVPTAADPRAGLTTRVLLRRRLGLSSIARAISSETPPEATFLETHVDRTRIALRMRGSALPKPDRPLLTVDLDIPGTTRAVLEILAAPPASEAEIQFYEHGVLLTSLFAKPWGISGFPIRYVIDAPRLPTNASRTQMRSDAELTRRIVERVLPMFTVAIAALRGEDTSGHTVKTYGDADALANALGAIVAKVILAGTATPLPEAARALTQIPIVYNAVGQLVSVPGIRVAKGGVLRGTAAAPLRVYDGAKAMPIALAPWLDGVLWKRGLPAERAIANLITASADDVIEPAMKALERRARAMQHAASPPVVTPSNETAHRESFKVEHGPFAGLHGEIAVLHVAPAARRLAKVRVFVDERALEEMTLPGVRLPLEIALAWPDHIVARYEYDAVARNEDLSRALHVALRLGVTAIATHLVGAGHVPDPELVRTAIQSWGETTRVLNDNAPLGALASLPAWRTNDDRLVGFDVIAQYASQTGAVCFANKSRAQAKDGRVIVARADVDTLRTLLPKVVFVPYDAYLEARTGLPEAPRDVAIMIQRRGLEGFVACGTGRIRVYHAGALIKAHAWTSHFGPVDIVLEDHAAVPKPGGHAIYASPLPDLEAEERLLVEKAIGAVEEGALLFENVRDYIAASAEKLDDVALRVRAFELPAVQERKVRARAKAAILARAPFDLAARVGEQLRGTASNKHGAVSVVLLASDELPRADLLYAGHPLGVLTRWAYPLDVFIDVVDDDLVTEDWSKLSDAGLTWADGLVVEASLDLLRKLVERTDFADDVAALKVLAGMVHESPTRASMIVQQVRWPTVQGGTMKIGDDTLGVKTGGNRYDPWQSSDDASPFDAPAIHLPVSKIGEARRRVLAAAGLAIEDVTEPVARLQAARGRSARNPPPRLDGKPAHPLLRASLAELGVTLADGEIELFEGDWSQVFKVNKEGVREPVPVALSFPVRAVCRTEGQWFIGIERELQRAVWQHLRSLVAKADQLPLFARKQLRRIVLAELATANVSARVFATTKGAWLSLADLKAEGGEHPFTTAAPPYPPLDDVVLCLDDAEATALAKLFPVKNVTEKLKRLQRGIERRNAPQRERAELDEAQRARCLFVIDVDEGGVRGQLGFLQPNHAATRGLELLHTRRPLCTIPDPEGWPLLAVLDDDALEPDASFEGLADAQKDLLRIQALVRRLVGPSVNRWLEAPTPTLGVIRLPTPFTIRAIKGQGRTPAALGIFWLPNEWPERPEVVVEAIGVSQPDRVPMLPRGPTSQIVPVCGKVWISADARMVPEAMEHVMAWVALRLVPHIRAADARHVERYRWDLALIGALDEPRTDPIKELARDRPDPDLMFVAARRAPQLIDKATGDAPAPAPLPMNVQDAIIVEEPVAPPPPSSGAPESFFAGLVRRVVDLVTLQPAPLGDTPLTGAVADALRAMSLTGDPVLVVRQARRGRPVTYVGEQRELRVNTTHPLVKAAARKPNGVVFLVVAALSEINRELATVTDAEEMAKLLDLLRANAGD